MRNCGIVEYRRGNISLSFYVAANGAHCGAMFAFIQGENTMKRLKRFKTEDTKMRTVVRF